MRTALVIAVVTAAAGAQGGPGTMESLAQAERAFARLCVETAERESFLANFAEDGVWFSPGPSNTKEALRSRPVPSDPGARTLDWEPVTGDVAVSGDLGYTTGPYTRTVRAADKGPTTGWFFSVWKRLPGAGWKVAADFGIAGPTSGTLRDRAFERSVVRGVAAGGRRDATALAEELRAADAAFVEDARARGLAAAFKARTTADVRLYRQGAAPIVGRQDAVSALPGGASTLTWQPSFAQASAAGDLGYTYGAYVGPAGEDGTGQHGYYLHVWKRLPDGWKLAVDVTN